MRLPTLLVAVTMVASPSFAQPAKHDLPKVPASSAKRAEVVLASADTARPAQAPALAQPSTEPRRPAPRITHCRCGDPKPGDATPE